MDEKCISEALTVLENLRHFADAGSDIDLSPMECRLIVNYVRHLRLQVSGKPATVAQVSDNANSPSHYTSGKVECIDAIESALTPEEFRGYCKGNALKYVWRERHKGGTEDLRKAGWYLDRLHGGGRAT